MHAASVRL